MNWVPVRLSSDNSGFVLSDALIAIVVVSALILLAYSAIRSASEANRRITDAYRQSEEQYETAILEIGECVCETEEPVNEESTDISLNSF